MGEFPLFEDGSISLKEIFADMPAGVRSMMGRGFATIGDLSSGKSDTLARQIKANVSDFSDTDVAALSESLGITEENASATISAATLLIALLSSRNEAPEKLIEELIEAGMIAPPTRAASLQLASSLSSDREAMKSQCD